MFFSYFKKINIFSRKGTGNESAMGLGMDTGRDWTMLFGAFSFFALIILLGNLYIFYYGYPMRDDFALPEEDVALDRAKLREVVAEWMVKEDRFYVTLLWLLDVYWQVLI